MAQKDYYLNNKQLGMVFEHEVCDKFAKEGYWVHFITPDRRGAQPFDIIAVKNGKALAVECKTLTNQAKYFPISRLEDNQIFAMEKWIACGNGQPIIAISWRNRMIMIPYSILKEHEKINLEQEWNLLCQEENI